MPTRRVLRWIGKVLLWCAAFVCLLSIGLRVYSAWQIPKAKRLLADISQIRLGQPFDPQLQKDLSEHRFRRDDSCANSTCYEAVISGAARESYGMKWSNRTWFLLCHGFLELGLRPWWLYAHIRVADGKVVSVGYRIAIADKTPIGIFVAAGHSSWKPELRSVGRDISVRENHQYGARFVSVDMNENVSSSQISSAFHPDMSCLWSLRPCATAWDIFPQFADYRTK